jgi:hypothetical protein
MTPQQRDKLREALKGSPRPPERITALPPGLPSLEDMTPQQRDKLREALEGLLPQRADPPRRPERITALPPGLPSPDQMPPDLLDRLKKALEGLPPPGTSVPGGQPPAGPTPPPGKVTAKPPNLPTPKPTPPTAAQPKLVPVKTICQKLQSGGDLYCTNRSGGRPYDEPGKPEGTWWMSPSQSMLCDDLFALRGTGKQGNCQPAECTSSGVGLTGGTPKWTCKPLTATAATATPATASRIIPEGAMPSAPNLRLEGNCVRDLRTNVLQCPGDKPAAAPMPSPPPPALAAAPAVDHVVPEPPAVAPAVPVPPKIKKKRAKQAPAQPRHDPNQAARDAATAAAVIGIIGGIAAGAASRPRGPSIGHAPPPSRGGHGVPPVSRGRH